MSDRASVDGHLAHSARIWGGQRTRAVRVARVPLRSRLEPVREAPAHAGRQEMLGVWARGRRAVGEGSPRRATASGQRPACRLGWERVRTAHGRVECGAPRAWRWHCVQAKPSLTYSTPTRSTQVVGLVDPYPPAGRLREKARLEAVMLLLCPTPLLRGATTCLRFTLLSGVQVGASRCANLGRRQLAHKMK